jgi:gliding motility-associated-like protein
MNPDKKTSTLFCPFLLVLCLWAIFQSETEAQSLQLTGSPQWVNLGDLDVTGNQITVEALINWQGGVNVLSKHTGPPNVNYLLRPNTFEITTTTQFYLMPNPYTLQNNVWYHIAGVYDGSFIRYYVNGCLVIEQAASGNMITNNFAAAVGNQSSTPIEQFFGLIDELRIWNVARTQAEIAANMNDLPNPTLQPGLLAYYKFNNNLLNAQGNATWNGTGVGAISYGPEAPVISPLSITSVITTNVSCFGSGNGSVVINASGTGVEYSINGTDYFAGNTFNNLNPGTYTAYIRSAEGCILTQNFTITEPPQLSGAFSQTICSGESFSFNGQNLNTSGVYTAVFTGTGGCDSTVTLNLTVIPSSGNPPAGSQFNTGSDGSGGTLPGGSADLSWTVATNSITGPYTPAVVMTSVPGNYYDSPWPDCGWIAHNANGSHSGNVNYYYQANFDLPCFNTCGQSYSDPGTFCLNLDFFADNAVVEIYVNGVPQSANIPAIPPANPFGYTGFAQANMVSVSLCDDWQPGNNSLIIHVQSGAPYAGFLAQASVNPPPVVSDTLQATICSGETYLFVGNTYDTQGQYTVTLQAANGCDSLVTLDLTVNPTPAAPQIVSNSPICSGDTLYFAVDSAGMSSVVWRGPNQFSSFSFENQLPSADTSLSGTYDVVVTQNGCDSPPSEVILTVNPIPQTPEITLPFPVCVDQNITLEGDAQPGASFFWAGPNGWTSDAQNPSLSFVQTDQAGLYTLIVELNGCFSPADTAVLTIFPAPVISLQGNTGCGQQVQFVVELDSLFFTPINYLWNLGDGTTVADTATFTHTYPSPGTYAVTFTVDAGSGICSFEQSGDVTVQESPSFGNITLPNIITPDGNGVNDELNIDNLIDECVTYEMKIYNRWGNLLYTQKKGSAPFAGKGMFGNTAPAGVYFYVLESGSEKRTGTITISY